MVHKYVREKDEMSSKFRIPEHVNNSKWGAPPFSKPKAKKVMLDDY